LIDCFGKYYFSLGLVDSIAVGYAKQTVIGSTLMVDVCGVEKNMIAKRTNFSCGCKSNSEGVIETCKDVLCACGHSKEVHLFGHEEHCTVTRCKCERFD
jgi:hypothetical protein